MLYFQIYEAKRKASVDILGDVKQFTKPKKGHKRNESLDSIASMKMRTRQDSESTLSVKSVVRNSSFHGMGTGVVSRSGSTASTKTTKTTRSTDSLDSVLSNTSVSYTVGKMWLIICFRIHFLDIP